MRVFAQEDFTGYARKRDQEIATQFPLTMVGSPSIRHPESVLKTDGTPYTVFTPYGRQWRLQAPGFGPVTRPDWIRTPENLASLPLPKPLSPPSTLFAAGENAAFEKLDRFTTSLEPPIYRYQDERNRLDLEGTSALSPYLRFGMISPETCLVTALEIRNRIPDDRASRGVESWINELAWRDFYLAILYHFPHVLRGNFREQGKSFHWEDDTESFSRWQEGLTGYPVIDASMRQLKETGWMHNRARMITASFLTKDLLVHWRRGEKWFMQQLIDGDPAANNGGWQWSAGTGADAAPYFRIFNPTIQSKKFDPGGKYIRQWVEELRNVPDSFIHEPWKMPDSIQRDAGCKLGEDYASPIVDHHWARHRALDLFKQDST